MNRTLVIYYCYLLSLSLWSSASPSSSEEEEEDGGETEPGYIGYNVCNGLSNQLLQHASAIAKAIHFAKSEDKLVISIPNHYIVNGVQTTDAPVIPSEENSVPLSSVFDTEYLLETIRGFEEALEPELVSFDFASASSASSPQLECIEFQQLATANPRLVLKILLAFRPSPAIQEMVDTIHSSLKLKSYDMSQGVCFHHRDGKDWHDHCRRWESIPDGIYRGNCLGVPHQSFVESLQVRGLSSSSLSPLSFSPSHGSNSDGNWAYYCGDHQVPDELQDSKATGFAVVSRSDLMEEKDTTAAMAKFDNTHSDGKDRHDGNSHRDLWALVDFFVCRGFDTFIGNSVSTFSALQIALRGGENAYWYNSQSIPLSTLWRAYQVPIVYTHTELGAGTGKVMLQASITSVREKMPNSPIHILYHGTSDHVFRKWLKDTGVKIHQHDPQWRSKIEEMRLHGDATKSHLFEHSGNFFGTWQRIDIPLFLNTEYCLYLDSDTVISRQFTMTDFGLNMAYGMAMSDEAALQSKPWNAGVTLMNVPRLRQTHRAYLEFIFKHIKTGGVFEGTSAPSDQGAALMFYEKEMGFLKREFNMKPYWGKKATKEKPLVWHFHGAKPHDYLKHAFGHDCSSAVQTICEKFSTRNVCKGFQQFARATIAGGIVDSFCGEAFPKNETDARNCISLSKLIAVEGKTCFNLKMEVAELLDEKKLLRPGQDMDMKDQEVSDSPVLFYFAVAFLLMAFIIFLRPRRLLCLRMRLLSTTRKRQVTTERLTTFSKETNNLRRPIAFSRKSPSTLRKKMNGESSVIHRSTRIGV